MDETSKAPDFVAMFTWAMERILKREYRKDLDADGNIDTLELSPKLSPYKSASAEEIERVIRLYMERAGIPRDKAEAFFALRERRTDEELETSLRALLFSPGLASRAAQLLDGADWGEILFFVDRQLSGLAKLESEDKLGEQMVKGREGFSTPEMRQVEKLIENRSSDLLSLVAARKYAAEYQLGFPEVVKRATAPEFRLLSASREVPESLQRYLIEASRCYIYGHFLASLIVCRSAIEEAVKQRLIDIRKQEEINRDDRLVTLLRLAKQEGLLDKTRYDYANCIRENARKAVHGKGIPPDKECVDALHKTRGILEHLYGRLQ